MLFAKRANGSHGRWPVARRALLGGVNHGAQPGELSLHRPNTCVGVAGRLVNFAGGHGYSPKLRMPQDIDFSLLYDKRVRNRTRISWIVKGPALSTKMKPI